MPNIDASFTITNSIKRGGCKAKRINLAAEELNENWIAIRNSKVGWPCKWLRVEIEAAVVSDRNSDNTRVVKIGWNWKWKSLWQVENVIINRRGISFDRRVLKVVARDGG